MSEIAFDKLVEPTEAQAKAVYDGLKNQSLRSFAGHMKQLGYKFSIATAGRWIEAGFVDCRRKPKQDHQTAKPKKAKKRLNKAVALASKAEVAEVAPVLQQIADAMNGGEVSPEIAALMEKTAEILEQDFKKKALAAGILLMDTLVNNRDLVIKSVPKDVGAMMESLSVVPDNLRNTGLSEIGKVAHADGATVIDGQSTRVEPKLVNPLSEKIAAFKRSHGMAAA